MPGSTSTATAAVAVWLPFAVRAALIGPGLFATGLLDTCVPYPHGH